MTTKKGGRHAVGNGKRKPKRRAVASPRSGQTTGALARPDQAPAPVEDNRPRQVVLDNTIPGGFRMEPV